MTAPQLTPELIAFLGDMKDRTAINDCLLRYTRGVDRHDRDLMLSAYWPDAVDQHGVAEGTAADFVDWALRTHTEYHKGHQHGILNNTVELDGDTAHAETYFIFWGRNREGRPHLSFGRYVDRFERRNGEWRIAHRVCLNELITRVDDDTEMEAVLAMTGPVRRDREDISYRRPLGHDRADS